MLQHPEIYLPNKTFSETEAYTLFRWFERMLIKAPSSSYWKQLACSLDGPSMNHQSLVLLKIAVLDLPACTNVLNNPTIQALETVKALDPPLSIGAFALAPAFFKEMGIITHDY